MGKTDIVKKERDSSSSKRFSIADFGSVAPLQHCVLVVNRIVNLHASPASTVVANYERKEDTQKTAVNEFIQANSLARNLFVFCFCFLTTHTFLVSVTLFWMRS